MARRSRYRDMDVMPSRDATKLYREGKITEEELLEIRKINKRKYEYTEKGQAARKRIQEREKRDSERWELRCRKQRQYYKENRLEILQKQKETYQKMKKEKQFG